MELTPSQQEQVIDLYVNQGQRITPVTRALIQETGWRWQDAYPLVSALLSKQGVMKRGHGVTFGAREFKWKTKVCDACHDPFQPSNANQRFCLSCMEVPKLAVCYGITPSDYKTLLKLQSGCCAICEVDLASLSERKVHIDHCHKTGKVRGVVCSVCNHRLSVLDNDTWVRKAQQYLSNPGIDPRCECISTRRIERQSSEPSVSPG